MPASQGMMHVLGICTVNYVKHLFTQHLTIAAVTGNPTGLSKGWTLWQITLIRPFFIIPRSFIIYGISAGKPQVTLLILMSLVCGGIRCSVSELLGGVPGASSGLTLTLEFTSRPFPEKLQMFLYVLLSVRSYLIPWKSLLLKSPFSKKIKEKNW